MNVTTNAIFEALKEIIPEIPDNVINLALTLNFNEPPKLEITSYVFESSLSPYEKKIKTFEIKEIK